MPLPSIHDATLGLQKMLENMGLDKTLRAEAIDAEDPRNLEQEDHMIILAYGSQCTERRFEAVTISGDFETGRAFMVGYTSLNEATFDTLEDALICAVSEAIKQLAAKKVRDSQLTG